MRSFFKEVKISCAIINQVRYQGRLPEFQTLIFSFFFFFIIIWQSRTNFREHLFQRKKKENINNTGGAVAKYSMNPQRCWANQFGVFLQVFLGCQVIRKVMGNYIHDKNHVHATQHGRLYLFNGYDTERMSNEICLQKSYVICTQGCHMFCYVFFSDSWANQQTEVNFIK